MENQDEYGREMDLRQDEERALDNDSDDEEGHMVHFFPYFFPLFMPFEDFDLWRDIPRNEKSAAATRREEQAKTKFDALRRGVEHCILQLKLRTFQLGVTTDENSIVYACPAVVLDNILSFVQPTDYTPNLDVDKIRRTTQPHPCGPSNNKELVVRDFATFYQPGVQHTFPLLSPKEHLTGPCWRDFRKHVRTTTTASSSPSLQHWKVIRTAASKEEKAAYGETRKGTVYFVKAVYTVPSPKKVVPPKKKKKKTHKKTKKLKDPPPSSLVASSTTTTTTASSSSSTKLKDPPPASLVSTATTDDTTSLPPPSKKLKTSGTTDK